MTTTWLQSPTNWLSSDTDACGRQRCRLSLFLLSFRIGGGRQEQHRPAFAGAGRWRRDGCLLPTRAFHLAVEHVPRRIVRLHSTGQLVPLHMLDGPQRRYRLARPQHARKRPRLHHHAVTARGDDPYRDAVGVIGELQRPTFAVGGGFERRGRHHAVLGSRHRLGVPGAALHRGTLRLSGFLRVGGDGGCCENEGRETEGATHNELLWRKVTAPRSRWSERRSLPSSEGSQATRPRE